MGVLLKAKGLRMSAQKQETLLKLTILSFAAILCEFVILIPKCSIIERVCLNESLVVFSLRDPSVLGPEVRERHPRVRSLLQLQNDEIPGRRGLLQFSQLVR